MPTIGRIRELCAQAVVSESGPEFNVLMRELENAIERFADSDAGKPKEPGLAHERATHRAGYVDLLREKPG